MEKSLKDLLSRLPIPGLKESADRHSAADILSKTLHIPIQARQIALKDGILTVSVPPVVKSAMQVKQAQIQDLLQKEGIIVTQLR